MKQEGRGSSDWKVDADTGTVLVRWLDRKAVNCLSNFVGVEPLGKFKRWSEKEKKKGIYTSTSNNQPIYYIG